jgi:hypothetical protein
VVGLTRGGALQIKLLSYDWLEYLNGVFINPRRYDEVNYLVSYMDDTTRLEMADLDLQFPDLEPPSLFKIIEEMPYLTTVLR